MRTLFVFLSIVPLIISGCAASKSSLPEERNAKTGRSDNSAKRYNTLTVSIEFHSGASTQPQGAARRANDHHGGQNNRSKSVNLPSSKIPVPTVAYDRDKDVFTYRKNL